MSDKLELMHAYVDGQLDGRELELAQELERTDPDCQREILWARKLKSSLRDSCPPIENQAGWQAAVSRLDEIDRTRRTEAFVGKYAWVLCAVFLIGILGAGLSNRAIGPRKITSSQVASVLSLPGNRSAQEDFSSDYIDLSNYRITQEIAGEMQGGIPYSRLSLQDRLGGLVLIVARGEMQIEGVSSPTGIRGFTSGQVEQDINAVSWKMRGHTFLIASGRPVDELLDHARAIVNSGN